MSKILRELLSDKLLRRHGYRTMEAKIKPVHIANALMRAEHMCTGKMSVLGNFFIATNERNTTETRVAAASAMIDAHKERWGALGEVKDVANSTLMTKVLPLLRTLLGADGAVFGNSPELSSFSSPTALTVTRDPSDDGAGQFVHRLWGGHSDDRLDILNLFYELTDPRKKADEIDDLSALLSPLAEGVRERKATDTSHFEDLQNGFSDVEQRLRTAAANLAKFERELSPNPISSIERIINLACLSVLTHASTRLSERYGEPRRHLLIDCSDEHFSPIAQASTRCVSSTVKDATDYLECVIGDLLDGAHAGWEDDPVAGLNALLEANGKPPLDEKSKLMKRIGEVIADSSREDDRRHEVCEEILREIEGNDRRGLDGYIRLLGIRSGYLYPVQKNPTKRLNPSDRTLEVLVMSTIDVEKAPVEYRDFLEQFDHQWSIIVGGGPSDSDRLQQIGSNVPAKLLRENSERFLDRLEALGMARRLADSVAVVGLMEAAHVK